MEENTAKEISTLKQMLSNWKTEFLRWASPDGDNEYVFLEFQEEIQVQLYPYIVRLLETQHLTRSEAAEFMGYAYAQVEDLRNLLSKI